MKESSISSLFGLKQKEMATLLGVGITHYSMFESGKRDLPLRAKQLLGEMLTYRQHNKASKKKTETSHKSAEWQKHLDKLRLENDYQCMKLEREIASAKRKLERSINLQDFSGFLKSAGEKGKNSAPQFNILAKKAAGFRENEFEMTVMKLEFRLELLLLEKNLIDAKLTSF